MIKVRDIIKKGIKVGDMVKGIKVKDIIMKKKR